MKPESIDIAIQEYAGFNLPDGADMTDAEIHDYFSQSHFDTLWPGDSDVSSWPWTFEQLADRVIEMRDEYLAK